MLIDSTPRRGCALALALAAALVAASPAPAGDDAFADLLVSYVPGLDPVAGYTDGSAAIGSPARFTGEGVFPGVVTIYNSPFLPDEIVSIGQGGALTVEFLSPVTDDPDNPWGIDLLVFSNAFFVDSGAGIDGLFGEGGAIEVSPDGATWAPVTGVEAEGLFPTQGYLDGGPFDGRHGTVPSDFTRPVNPCLTMGHLTGLDFADARSLYLDSGGGAAIDLAGTGFAQISFVRISNAAANSSVEIDAVADVSPSVPGDVNRDLLVNIDDIVEVILQWGPLGPGRNADLNGDCAIDIDDLVLVVLNFTGAP